MNGNGNSAITILCSFGVPQRFLTLPLSDTCAGGSTDYQRLPTHYYRWTIIPTSAILPTLQSLACGDNAVQTLIDKQPFVNKVDYLFGDL